MRLYVLLGLLGAGAALVAGCKDNNTDTCPATFNDGDACDSTDLECPHDVTVTGCDGTVSKVASSCTCTEGKWACTDPGNQCPSAGGSGGAGGGAHGGGGQGGQAHGGGGHGGAGTGGSGHGGTGTGGGAHGGAGGSAAGGGGHGGASANDAGADASLD
jgi:hypothetical protein